MNGFDKKNASSALIINRKLCAKLTGVDESVLKRIDIDDQKITDIIVSCFLM